MTSCHSGGAKSLGNNEQLQVVETTYDVERLNAAQKNGLKSLIVPVSKNSSLVLKSLLIRNKSTAEIIKVSGWKEYQQCGVLEYSEKDWDLIYHEKDYARVRKSEQNWGAYILPEKVGIGERLYIAELVEDVVAASFWSSVWYAADGIAEWNGTNLILDLDMYNVFHMVG